MSEAIGFEHAPTLRRAFLSSAAVKIVWGPVESGKTVWLCSEVYRLACTIPRCVDGVRRSRFLLIRSTEAELERGIMRTWREWLPEEIYGPITGSMPALHRMRFLDVECEVEFFAFEDDSEAVLKKLRSTEYTAIGFNEGQFTPLRLLLMARQRAGRFPKKVLCPDFDRVKRVWMDMNSPRTNDHFVLYMRGDIPLPADMDRDERRKYQKPDDWEIFKQPGSVRAVRDGTGEIEGFEINPEAENQPFWEPEPVLSMCRTGDIEDIRRDYLNEVVSVKSGRPRYSGFKRAWHVAPKQIFPVEGVPPIIGYDPGLTGAATFWQKINDQWRGFREMIAEHEGARAQGDRMLDILRRHFPWYRETGVTCWGDPFGSWGGVDPNETYYSILSEMGLNFQPPAAKDNPTLRHQTGMKLLKEGSYEGPRLLLCPAGMPRFIEAIEGGAVMRIVKRDGQMVTQEEIVKNNHSHVMEAGEYAWWGGGESYSIVERPKEATPGYRIEAVSRSNPLRAVRSAMWMRR